MTHNYNLRSKNLVPASTPAPVSDVQKTWDTMTPESRCVEVQYNVIVLMNLVEAPSDPFTKKAWEIAQKAKTISQSEASAYVSKVLDRFDQLKNETNDTSLDMKTRLIVFEKVMRDTYGLEALPYLFSFWQKCFAFVKASIDKHTEFDNFGHYTDRDWWIESRPFFRMVNIGI